MNSTSLFSTTSDTLPIMTGLNNDLPTSLPPEASSFVDEGNWTSAQANWTSPQANWTTTEPPEFYKVSATVMNIYFSFRVLWGLLSMIGNGITIVMVARFEVFHTSSNYLICSLAVSDLLSIPTVPLTIIHQTYTDSVYFVQVCLIEQVTNVVYTATSITNIMYISIDRYMFIAYPLRYHSIVTSSKTFTLIGLTWLYFLVSTPLSIYLGSRLTIGMTCKFSVFLIPSIYQLYMTPQFLVLLFLTIWFNVSIARIAHKQSRAIAVAQQSDNTPEASMSRRSRKISRMLGTVLGGYLLCLMPQYFMTLIIHRRVTGTLLAAEKFTLIVYWASTWVNPLIYVWRLKQYRVAFKKLFTGRGSLQEFADTQ